MNEEMKLRLFELKQNSDEVINNLWINYNSLSLGDFVAMQWHHNDRYPFISNHYGLNSPSNFKIFFTDEESSDFDKKMRCEKIAVILATEFKITRNSKNIINKTNSNKLNNQITQQSLTDQTYNDMHCNKFLFDYLNIHNFCIYIGFNHKLHYNSKTNLWRIEILSGDDKHIHYSSEFNILSKILDDVVDFLNSFKRF